VLRGRVQRYGYVSSMSVYAWGSHVDESSPLVAGDALAGDGDYPALKRGAEMGVLAAHPDAVVARAGLILGPHEDIGRLPWWLQRISRGGRVVAPGRPARPLQYVDVRDLASWLLSALSQDLAGPVDVASRSGHATTEQLLQACVRATGSNAQLVWVSETDLQAHGVERSRRSRAGSRRLAASPASSRSTPPRRPAPGWSAGQSPTRSPTPGSGSSGKACRPNDQTGTSTDCPQPWSSRCWRRSSRTTSGTIPTPKGLPRWGGRVVPGRPGRARSDEPGSVQQYLSVELVRQLLPGQVALVDLVM
jgi:hypothetical protein